jgi:uncharacterized protein
MTELFESQTRVLKNTNFDFRRSIHEKLPWDERALMILGARGTGKTTLFLQHLKENYKPNEALYLTLDDIYFKQHTLVDTAREFLQNDGKLLLLDEVHKYPDWSREVKNIYDLMPSLKLLITGSSVLELEKSGADLSRRILNFNIPELSFREFLSLSYKLKLEAFSLTDILKNHVEISTELMLKLEKPLFYFKKYLEWGAYPFFKETNMVHARLKQTINLIIDTDIPNAMPVEFSTLNQLKKLLYIIAQSVPFKPNVTKLAEQIGVSRPKLYEMLKMLEAARLTYGLYTSANNITALNKPEKLFLHNSNLMYALSEKQPEVGTIRETFFINMLQSAGNSVDYTENGDFIINKNIRFEIGGRNKTTKQIQGKENGFLGLDEIETGYANKIPLWLFGFMY